MPACARVCIFAKLFGEFNVAIGTWVFLCGVGLQVHGENVHSTSACLRRCACTSCWVEMAAANWVQAAHSTYIFIISSFSPLPVYGPYPLVSCLTASLLLLFSSPSPCLTLHHIHFWALLIHSALFVPCSLIRFRSHSDPSGLPFPLFSYHYFLNHYLFLGVLTQMLPSLPFSFQTCSSFRLASLLLVF